MLYTRTFKNYATYLTVDLLTCVVVPRPIHEKFTISERNNNETLYLLCYEYSIGGLHEKILIRGFFLVVAGSSFSFHETLTLPMRVHGVDSVD